MKKHVKSFKNFNENVEIINNDDKIIELKNSISKSVEELNNKINGLDLDNFDLRTLEKNIKLIKITLQDFNSDNNLIADCEEIIELLYEIYSVIRYNRDVINDEQVDEFVKIIFDDLIDKLTQINKSSSNEKVDLIDEIEKSLTPLLKQLDFEISKRGEEYEKWIGYGDNLLNKINDIKGKDYTNLEISNWLGKISNNFIGLARYPRSKNDVELTDLIDKIIKLL